LARLPGRRGAACALLGALLAPRLLLSQTPAGKPAAPIDGGGYYPTPDSVVARMLALAGVRAGDVVYDLGSGDGRVVIQAARRYGVRAVGVERDSALVRFARDAAQREGVDDRVRFEEQDIFEADLRPASVVTMYLLPRLLVELAPKLRAELAPGSRIVSHDFPMEGWPPESIDSFESEEKAQAMGIGTTQLFLYRTADPR
jgi:SAM-dependent methyltransferase